MKKIRVLVVDDSALMRKMIPRLLCSDSRIEVVGTAMDGLFALKKIGSLRPDVVTLDLNMPRMDGLETLRHIVDDFGIPALVVSSFTKRDADLTFSALEIGAFDFVTKPQDAISVHIHEIVDELIEKVRAAYENRHARTRARKLRAGIGRRTGESENRGIGEMNTCSVPDSPSLRHSVTHFKAGRSTDKVLAIGISTGGPNALSYLLPRIPKDFPAAVLIVQHMPAGFTEAFAARLNDLSEIEVKEAADGDLLIEGRALIAPGDRHLRIKRMPLGTIAVLSDAPPVKGHRPSADVMFRSVAGECGPGATGLIMTGMGDDGAEGIGEIMARGGLTVAQDEESCVVFGMPKAAVEKGHIKSIVSLEDMGGFLVSHFCGKEEEYGAAKC